MMAFKRRLATAIAGAVTMLAILSQGAAAAPSAWWGVDAMAAPTYLPLSGEGQITVTATNLGDAGADGRAEAEGGKGSIILQDQLPAGVKPVSVAGNSEKGVPGVCELEPVVACTFTKVVLPYEALRMRITVEVEGAHEGALANFLSVRGAGVTPATMTKPLQIRSGATPFGVETYEMLPENEGGSPDFQAGGHPFQLTTRLDFNTTLATYATLNEKGVFPSAPRLPRDLHFRLPVGLVGAVSAVPKCSETDFSAVVEEGTNQCSPQTAVGAAVVTINDPIPLAYQTLTVPVFNLQPGRGEPARFGFEVQDVPVVLKTAVPAGGEYAVEVSVTQASQAAQVLGSTVTLWGAPGAASHDDSRGWQCVIGGKWAENAEPPEPCLHQHDSSPKAFLTLPGSCLAPPTTTVSGDSWGAGPEVPPAVIEPSEHTTYTFPQALTGCEKLPFEPSVTVAPETTAGSTATGLNVDLRVPQGPTLDPEAPAAEADIREATVTLPEGLALNPSSANGLQACSALAFGFTGPDEGDQLQNASFEPSAPLCPDASKVGSVAIETPLLESTISGTVYLAEQDTNPFVAPLVLYLLAEDPETGIRVKLAGSLVPTPGGQLISTFKNTPQLPFSDLRFHFFGDQRPPLTTPARCGAYSASSNFVSWSGVASAPNSSPVFQITSGPGGGPCTATSPFAPSVDAGADDDNAGAFTPFSLTIGNPDGSQPLERVDVKLPQGIAALIAAIPRCSEAHALADSCPASSIIGHTLAVAGVGGEPIKLGGQLYLTDGLKATTGHPASPFGLLAVTHAAAGPFDLGDVTVLSAIEVDPNTAAVSVISEPLPKLLHGIPVDLKQLTVTVERPGRQEFEFNPTNCDPLAVTGVLSGYEGGHAPVGYPFQVKGCAQLPFHPVLKANTQGQASRVNGASLTVKVTAAGLGQANISKVALQLPKALPSRLGTIQKACPEATFAANPATCDEGSMIGTATVHSPILAQPLTGPAYLVSHGGAAFPDVEFVLQGEGIELVLDGKTDIKHSITYSRFESTPDAPFTSFEAVLPQGPHSALGAFVPAARNYNLCGTSLAMPTTITGQNGAVIQQTTKIAIQGCRSVASFKRKKLTPTQKLKKTLVACHKRFTHAKAKRAHCEASARRTYRASRVAGRRR